MIIIVTIHIIIIPSPLLHWVKIPSTGGIYLLIDQTCLPMIWISVETFNWNKRILHGVYSIDAQQWYIFSIVDTPNKIGNG